MRILVVAATEGEVGSFKSEVGSWKSKVGSPKSEVQSQAQDSGLETQDSRLRTQDLEFLITGVGMVATAFALGRHLAVHKYDLAINLGIAGSFDHDIALGEVLEITQDTFAELGAEDDAAFLPITKLGIGWETYYPTPIPLNTREVLNAFSLKTAKAITVNTVHGSEASIKKVTERLNPQLESMEGAAFFYACAQMNIPCLQIRAVSNYVEKRNRANWKIPLAIENLNAFAIDFLRRCS